MTEKKSSVYIESYIRINRKKGFYEKYVKRMFDIICSVLVLVLFFWVYIIIAFFVKKKMGSPVIFKQARPGIIGDDGQETIFYMYKFRTMTEEKDDHGELLPDEMRLGKFGKMLRATSLDELPEVFNILKGEMSLIGPRPQLVRDMVFMSDRQRIRHTVKPGLSGLAQINGRNAITWEEKFEWDLKYVEEMSFWFDIKLVIQTIKKVFIRRNITVSNSEIEVAMDYGDALLAEGKIEKLEYEEKQNKAKILINQRQLKRG